MECTEAQLVKDCLMSPGARIIARKLRQASKGTLRRYDKCKPEELVRYQMLREIINRELPRIIDGLVNTPPVKSRWNWLKVIFG